MPARVGGTFDDSGTKAVQSDVVHSPFLVVLLECDRPLAGSARYGLEGVERVLIGRGDQRGVTRSNDGGVGTLHVRLPGAFVSLRHARIVRTSSSWVLEDLGSKNGTFVNGDRVVRAVIGPDDVWGIGRTFGRINESVPMSRGDPTDVDVDATVQPRDAHETLLPAFAHQISALRTIALSDVPVLLLGASGTGKELVARSVHAMAQRRGDFVPVNCGAIAPSLVETTLFGHVKGAFSGAVGPQSGFVRAAHDGTLFLDEIGDLPPTAQPALLRVLQEREVVPVGATKPIRVDLRVVAATHQSLEDMVADGRFRRDLFSRIAGFRVDLPTLHERRDDIGLLVAALLRRIAGKRAAGVRLSEDAGRALVSYDWPMNIRELEQALATSITLAGDGCIERRHLPAHVAPRALDASHHAHSTALSPKDERLRLDLLDQLARHRGNLAEVARSMGKARMQIHRWCRRFGVDPNVYRS